jgi:hypothetical protein
VDLTTFFFCYFIFFVFFYKSATELLGDQLQKVPEEETTKQKSRPLEEHDNNHNVTLELQ